MPIKKDPKLIREINAIINDPSLHFWIKCKQLVKIKIHKLRDGVTYHGSSVLHCMVEWKKKKEISKAGAKILNMKILRRFGFCPDGIRSFCSANNLDSHETYTLAEIKRVVKKNIQYNRMYYGRELQQVGIL